MSDREPTEREWLEGLRYEDKFPDTAALEEQVRQLQQERDIAREDRAFKHQQAMAAEAREKRLEARLASLTEALRYIAGFDVAGYEAHMRPEEVAEKVLTAAESGRKPEAHSGYGTA